MIKAGIFDVDGTLFESNDLHVEAWREAFRCYGKEVSFEELHEQMGKGGDQLMPVFCTGEELDGAALNSSRATTCRAGAPSRECVSCSSG